MQTTRQRYCINGVEYHVTMAGAGSPLLFLHGFTGSSASWQAVIDRLAAHYWCIAPDLLGHGGSAAPADWHRYSLEHAIDDMLTLLACLRAECCSLVGYSMGGRLALGLACKAPENFHALVLEGASPGLADGAEQVARAQADDALAEFIIHSGLSAFVSRWENLPLFASQRLLPWPVRKQLRRQRLSHTAAGLACALRGMSTGRQQPLWNQLSSLSLPVLLIAGALDRKYSQIALDMQAKLPFARLALVDGAGHNVHLEKPSAYLTIIESFLATS